MIPTLDGLIKSCEKLEINGKDILKMGWIHIQDALSITFGEEASGWTYI